MVTDPDAEAEASPEALIEAIVVSAEVHWTVFVMSFDEPSDKSAVARNCCMPPALTDADPGEIKSAETDGDCDWDCDPEPPPQLLIIVARNKSPIQKAAFISPPSHPRHASISEANKAFVRLHFCTYLRRRKANLPYRPFGLPTPLKWETEPLIRNYLAISRIFLDCPERNRIREG